MAETVLAVDIGGTKIAAGVVAGDGVIESRAQRHTPTSGDPEEVYAAVVDVARSALESARSAPQAIGCGCGGPMVASLGQVSPLNIGAWRGFPLAARLESTFSTPCHLANDAVALAMAEGRWGAARGQANYLAMVISTGVGGGLVVDGRPLSGRDGNAGHVGHLVVVEDGRPCRCGARGCLEAEASGTAIAERTGRPAAEAPLELRVHAGQLVGRAVAQVVNLLDLPACYVAGSVALGFGAPFFDAAQRELDERCRIDHGRGATIEVAGLGAEGPLLGAAAVALGFDR